MSHLVADLYRWSWGRWRDSEAHYNCYRKHKPNVKQQAHWLLIQKE